MEGPATGQLKVMAGNHCLGDRIRIRVSSSAMLSSPIGATGSRMLTVRHGYAYNCRLTAMQAESHPELLPKERLLVRMHASIVPRTIKEGAESCAESSRKAREEQR